VAEGVPKQPRQRLELQSLDGLRVFVLVLSRLLTRRVKGASAGLQKITVKMSASFYIGQFT
jgi:hypothetical protein